MADYPILTEISNFILDNLEVFILVITPLAILISFLSKKLYERIHSVEDQAAKLLSDQGKDLNKRIDVIEGKVNDFEERIRETTKIIIELVNRVDDKYDSMYKEFRDSELNVVTNQKAMDTLIKKYFKPKTDSDLDVTGMSESV
jgi:SMC interacting uncharacterized protein involved in chromosome segregation